MSESKKPKGTVFLESLITGGELRYNLDTTKFYADLHNKNQWQEYRNKEDALIAAVEATRGHTR